MLLHPNRVCATCTDEKKTRWGCSANAPIPMFFDGEELWRCPLRPYYEDPMSYSDLFEAESWSTKGYLPDPGQWPDQSHRFTLLMRVVSAARNEAELELSKKQ